MKLAKLEASGVNGVQDGAYNLDANLVAILGGRGSGRTRLLRTLAMAKEAVGSYGPRVDLKPWVEPEVEESWVRAHWRLTSKECEFAEQAEADCEILIRLPLGVELEATTHGSTSLPKLFSHFDRDTELGKMVLFPANRWPRFGSSGVSLRDNPALLLAGERSKYSGVGQLILEAWLDGRKDAFTTGISSLVPGLQIDSGRLVEGNPVLSFSRDSTTLTADELELSEQDAVLFASVILGLKLQNSVLLIEEPELHWSDREQADWVRSLAKLEPSNQLILATSSERVAGAADTVIKLDGSPRPRVASKAKPLSVTNRLAPAGGLVAAGWGGSHSSPPSVAPTPAVSSSPAPTAATPALDVRQLACIMVELEREPTRRQTILQQYDLDEASFAAENQLWQSKFVTDRDSHDSYRNMVEYFSALMGR